MKTESERTFAQRWWLKLRFKLWRRVTRVFARELVQDLYRGVLGRKPDLVGGAEYLKALSRPGDLAGIIDDLVASPEFRRKNFIFTPEELVRAFYRGIGRREVDPEALKTYVLKLTEERRLEGVLAQMIGSEELRQSIRETSRPHPKLVRDGECWVFVHVSKTAGSSVQNHLAEAFPAGTVYKEHADTLAQRRMEEFSRHLVFAGHFNYDSLVYVPREKISVFTFVREPTERLLSYYYFRRAHEPGHSLFGFEMEAANQLDVGEFFQHPDIKIFFQVWNHMTWAIMGQRQWEAWKWQIAGSSDTEWINEFVRTVADPAIRRRMREFAFVGLQEEFDRSVKMLFKVLGKPAPESVHSENTLASLMQTAPYFKQKVERQTLTENCTKVLESLVQLDNVVYDEAKAIFAEQAARLDQPERPPIAGSRIPEGARESSLQSWSDGATNKETDRTVSTNA